MIMNTKKLGKEQKRLLELIARNRLIISTYEYYGEEYEIILCSFDGNDILESISKTMFNSLIKRDIFQRYRSLPSINVEVCRYVMRDIYRNIFKAGCKEGANDSEQC